MTREIYKNWGLITYRNDSNEYHREGDKPSIVYFDGYIYFCKNNKYHRKGKPSKISFEGTLYYCEDDKSVKFIKP